MASVHLLLPLFVCGVGITSAGSSSVSTFLLRPPLAEGLFSSVGGGTFNSSVDSFASGTSAASGVFETSVSSKVFPFH